MGENVAVVVGENTSLAGELAATDDVDIKDEGCKERSVFISWR